MVFDKSLLKILACPNCKSGLTQKKNQLVCANCKKRYPIENDIPMLLP
ncbi:Trm112 family protein [Candidatus Woesearchaeota archaeon]|nr:Trm112 family protein [Candidatus Woesearchaeota archaeon]